MRQGIKVLVLAGTAEARICAVRAVDGGARVHALVSENPRGPNPMPVPYDLLAFEDARQLAQAMAGFDAVLDASHGFDDQMSDLGYAAARELGLPFLSYQRPGWDEPAAHRVPDVKAALDLIAPGARVFSATGWASLPEYAGFPGARLLLRQTVPHDRVPPFAFVELVFGEAPFTVQSERALFRDLEIDTLICRNLGGAASRPKVDAALADEIQLILIERPPLPKGVDVVREVDDALHWLDAL